MQSVADDEENNALISHAMKSAIKMTMLNASSMQNNLLCMKNVIVILIIIQKKNFQIQELFKHA